MSNLRFVQSLESIKSIETYPNRLPDILPLVHVTDAYGARSILETAIIKARPCKHFAKFTGVEESLAYFSYGKPSYRNRENGINANGASYPVAFLVDVNLLDHPIKRIFPFDTGGFGLYSDFLHHKMKPLDFNLGEHIEMAQRLVLKLYDTNLRYLKDTVRPHSELAIDPLALELLNYHAMIENRGATKSDSRNSTVEIQFERSIPLTVKNFRGLIVPESLSESSQFKSLLGKFRINAVAYSLTRGSSPEYDGALIAKTVDSLAAMPEYGH